MKLQHPLHYSADENFHVNLQILILVDYRLDQRLYCECVLNVLFCFKQGKMFWCLYVNFEQISHIILEFPLSIMNI